MPGRNTLWSAGIFFESKDTAAQIKLIFVLGHAVLEVSHNPALNVFAVPHSLDHPGFAQNAKMFGDIVLGNLQPLRQFGHSQWPGQQFLHDPPPGLVRQSLEKWRAAFRIKRCHTL
jgi:hypothetical protein